MDSICFSNNVAYHINIKNQWLLFKRCNVPVSRGRTLTAVVAGYAVSQLHGLRELLQIGFVGSSRA